jgi:hypothetical protein
LAQEISNDSSTRTFIRKTLPADTRSNFFRIESKSLYNNGNDKIDLYIKALEVNDISLGFPDPETSEKTVVINGIVSDMSQSPENIIGNGIVLSQNGEIIIDFIKPIYINEISFDAKYASHDSKGMTRAEFEFSTIPSIEKESLGNDLLAPSDWVSLGNSVFYGNLSNSNRIYKKDILSYVQALRIIIKSQTSLKLSDIEIKGFSSGLANQIEYGGDIKSPELVIVDDISGLLESAGGSVAGAFASFESNNSYIEFDLGQIVPATRITMNVAGDGETSTRTLQVDTWDGVTLETGDPVFENIFTGPSPNYEFSLIRWEPRPKENSRKVEIEFMDSLTQNPEFTENNLGKFLVQFNNASNNSGLLSRSGLSGWSFKPDAFGDRTISVSSSESRFETGTDEDYVDANADGLIVVNAQMDEGGPFNREARENTVGILENKLNIDFPIKDVRKIRIMLRNQLFGGGSLKINGLRIYAPIVNSSGVAISPVSMTEHSLRFKVNVSTEK